MNINDIKSLVELMSANDLSRIEIHEGETHIVLRRGQTIVAAQAAPAFAMSAPPPPAATASPAGAGAAPAASDSARETVIRSPMVGTYYSASEPEAPPFVSVGSRIGPETVVCLVEAMKVFNEIKAEASGTIARVLVKNGQAVEYDQPLFVLTPD